MCMQHMRCINKQVQIIRLILAKKKMLIYTYAAVKLQHFNFIIPKILDVQYRYWFIYNLFYV